MAVIPPPPPFSLLLPMSFLNCAIVRGFLWRELLRVGPRDESLFSIGLAKVIIFGFERGIRDYSRGLVATVPLVALEPKATAYLLSTVTL